MEIRPVLAVIIFVYSREGNAWGLSEDGRLDFVELAEKYDRDVEEFEVLTEDGYKLKLFRLPGGRRGPLLLMHGVFDSADTWIIRGNTSLAITLVDRGHDVWAGNCRGNKYGRSHVRLDPDVDEEFWEFSFEEFGYYDLPAIIDSVLNHTAAGSVTAIGHSQGNTIFYVLAATRPEYNEKVNLMIALSPICFLQNVPPPLKTIIELSPSLNELAEFLNLREMLGENSALTAKWRTLCPKPLIGYKICIQAILFLLTGDDEDELEPDFVPTVVGHFPTGTSEKNLYHFGQVASGRKFARYDYGAKVNFAIYNRSTPPEYDLSAVRFKVALLVGANDKLSTPDDVAILRQKLPNVVYYLLIPRRKMNHPDFIWGRHIEDYLLPYLFDLI
ncbi:unnamed protein product, partial [Iphiclides podalirius]